MRVPCSSRARRFLRYRLGMTADDSWYAAAWAGRMAAVGNFVSETCARQREHARHTFYHGLNPTTSTTRAAVGAHVGGRKAGHLSRMPRDRSAALMGSANFKFGVLRSTGRHRRTVSKAETGGGD
jgi:hypothetical protein